MKASPLLPLYQAQHAGRAGRDRLELLTALIGGPAFDPLLRAEVIRIPAGHPVFRWVCLVAGCARPRKGSLDMCHVHHERWAQAQARGEGKAAFLASAQPLGPSVWMEQLRCRICPARPAAHACWRLCHRHNSRWYHHQRGQGQQASFEDWLAAQSPFDGYGPCRTTFAATVAKEMLHDLRLAYFTPEASRDAGFIETDHFGVRFADRGSHFDLTGTTQRWLRDLLWDYLAGLLQSPDCPRTGGTFDTFRRAAMELSGFLTIGAPGGGHDPAALTAAHIQQFVADQPHREREGRRWKPLASVV